MLGSSCVKTLYYVVQMVIIIHIPKEEMNDKHYYITLVFHIHKFIILLSFLVELQKQEGH